MKRKIEEMVQEKADMIKLQRFTDPMKMLQTEVSQIQDNCGEFLWCIKNWEVQNEQFRNGIDKSICSVPFYSHRNGYKMRMMLQFNDVIFGPHFSFYLQILRGEFDNILQWPFRHEVQLDFMNQETDLPVSIKVLKAAENPDDERYKKPTKGENEGIEFGGFYIPSRNAAVTKGNQICIKATTKINP